MVIVLGTHQLTLVGDENCDSDKNHVRTFKNASLTITGDASGKGKILDQTRGMSAANDNAKLTMENVEYTTDHNDTDGIFINKYSSRASIDIKNSTIHSLYFCVSTNASAPVGSGNTIKLTDCTLVGETALLVNTPVTVTAKNCSFTGDWHAAFLRGGTSTFENCSFNLSVKSGNINTHTTWGTGNEVPSAAITAGNRNNNDTDYNYKTTLTLNNNCAFTVKKDGETSTDYPAIYLDAKENVATQGVTFTYDESCKAAVEAAGALVIKNTNGEVTVNGETYKGSDVPE